MIVLERLTQTAIEKDFKYVDFFLTINQKYLEMLSALDLDFNEVEALINGSPKVEEPDEVEEVLSTSKELMVLTQEQEEYAILNNEYPEEFMPEKTLRRLIRQYTHPDKLLRFAMSKREVLVDLYMRSSTHNYAELVYIFCHVMYLSNKMHRARAYMKDTLELFIHNIDFKCYELSNKWYFGYVRRYIMDEKDAAINDLKEFIESKRHNAVSESFFD